MLPPQIVLAKGDSNGRVSLKDHTEHVVLAIEKFAIHYSHGFNTDIAKAGAVLHDLGKAHPHFQRKIRGVKASSLNEERVWNFTHRHEISSLAFLPCFAKAWWPDLVELVVGHHKSIVNDAREKGILDLTSSDRKCIENHLLDWESWSGQALQVLEDFGYSIRPISKQDAAQAIEYAIEYCESIANGVSSLRGLLMSADHFASSFNGETASKLQNLFTIPDLSFYRDSARRSPIYPLSLVSDADSRPHTLVVAPTGAGKTDFLLRRCRGRIFYTLPYQASINAMFDRIKHAVNQYQPDADIRLLHASSSIALASDGKNVDEAILQPLAGSSVKVLTPHQLASIIFGTKGYEAVLLDLEGTDVILDEIHTYSDFSRAMVLEIVRTLLRVGCRIHIGTATMPSSLYAAILELLGGSTSVLEVSLSEPELQSFDRHVVSKMESEEEINTVLDQAFRNQEKVLVVFNTVGKAQKFFRGAQELYPNIPMMLIHSRFRRMDRSALERRLISEFNGNGSAPHPEGTRPCLVVSTQVVEVSLDISFDRMITQCAPIDGLIQRFGRVNRKRTSETIGKYKPVHVIKPTGNVLPYVKEVLDRSFAALPDHFEVLHEAELQSMIDIVYPSLDFQDIDIHLIYKYGDYVVKKLTNSPKSVLVDALEIESASCILEQDREQYEEGPWEVRQSLEIPVNFKSIARHAKEYVKLDVGSNPFVVPQSFEEYQTLGLILTEHNNII